MGVLLLVLVLLAAFPAGARAEWSPPFEVSARAGTVREAQVAVDPAGAAVAVWLSGSTAQARRIEADGTLGPVLDLSAPGLVAALPDVAIDVHGNATAVWSDRVQGDRDEFVRARRIGADGVLGPTIDLTTPGFGSRVARVAVDAAGAVTVLWHRPGANRTVHLRRIDPVGGPGATLEVAPPVSGQADLAVGADGTAHVAWVAGAAGTQRAFMRRVSPGGDLGPVLTLSDDTQLAFSPQIEVDAAGNAVVVWPREDNSLELRRVAADGGLGPVEVVAPAGVAERIGDHAVDAAGNATIVWWGMSGANWSVFLRRAPASGPVGPINDLWVGGHDFDPLLVLDGAGVPTLIWSNSDAAGSAIRTRTAPAGAALGPILEPWPPVADQSVGSPAIAGNAAGEMTAVWELHTGEEEQVMGARFALPPAPSPAPPAPPAPPDPLAPPSSPAPPAAAAGTDTGARAGCAAVTLGRLGPHTGGRPARAAVEGVAARLRLNRRAHLDLRSARVAYRLGGRSLVAPLRAKDRTTGPRAVLRFALPRAAAAALAPGDRVTLTVRLRARAATKGCAYGKASTLRLRTKVVRIAA